MFNDGEVYSAVSVQCTVSRLTCSRLVTLSGPASPAEDMLASQSLSSPAHNDISQEQ